jgi:hypothetical protein
MSSYGTLTTQDIQDAMKFASDQINRLKCEDQNILTRMCTGDNKQCVVYKEEDYKRDWPTISNRNVSKKCADYSYGGEEGDSCYVKKTEGVDKADNKIDGVYPFCISNKGDDGEDDLICGWTKSDTVERLRMTSGTCVATDEYTCKRFSKYKNTKVVPGDDGDLVEVSTTRDRKGERKENKGVCAPDDCDPDCDENCLPRRCQTANCNSDRDCRTKDNLVLPGFTGECNPTSTIGNGYCVVDENYSCTDNSQCGALGEVGIGKCELTGKYDLDKIENGSYKDCWKEREEGDGDKKECNLTYTTGECYEEGPCPQTQVPSGINQVYLEWHADAGECNDTSTCKNGECVNGKCTCTINGDCPGTSICGSDGKCTPGGQCVYGNEWMREICEQPQCRPEYMMAGAFNNNNTLPPWAYDDRKGECRISRSFCAYGYMPYGIAKKDWKASKIVTWDSDTNKIYDGSKEVEGCETDEDCANIGDGDWRCMDDYDSYNKKQGGKSCSGPGAQCASGNFGDMMMENLFGETLYNSIKYGEACVPGGGMTERFKMKVLDHFSKFEDNKEVASVSISKHAISSQTLTEKDVVPGIDVFQTQYVNGTKGVGFSIDQIRTVMPDKIKMTPNGDEYLVILPDQKLENPEISKLYFLLTL